MRRTLLGFAIVVLIVLGLGFLGYRFGFLGFIYNIMMPEAFGQFSLILLSVLFGTAAFFSPCTFTVLPAYVSHYLSSGEGPMPQRNIRKGIYFGFIAALGILTVNLVLGLIVAGLGSAAPFAKDPRQDIPLILGVRIVAGLLIATLGFITISGRTFHLPFLDRLIRMDFGKSVFGYGVLYNAAAVGCTGPILLGLILYALTIGTFSQALLAFVIFAATMSLWMIILTVSIATLKSTLAQKLKPLSPTIKKAAGIVMLLTGITIALLTIEGNRVFVKLFFPFLQ